MNDREQTTIRLPSGLLEQLQREAEELGISFNSLVLMILNEAKSRQERLTHVVPQNP